MRNAVIDFYKEIPTNPLWKNIGKIYTVDEKLNAIISKGTSIGQDSRWISILPKDRYGIPTVLIIQRSKYKFHLSL